MNGKYTATFNLVTTEVIWKDGNGNVIIGKTQEQLMCGKLFYGWERQEIEKESPLFSVKYDRLSQLNSLWLQESEKAGYHPNNVKLISK